MHGSTGYLQLYSTVCNFRHRMTTISKFPDTMLGRHFEHVLWSNEFHDAMEDVDFIFILQKPTNMIGHLGGGSFDLAL